MILNVLFSFGVVTWDLNGELVTCSVTLIYEV